MRLVCLCALRCADAIEWRFAGSMNGRMKKKRQKHVNTAKEVCVYIYIYYLLTVFGVIECVNSSAPPLHFSLIIFSLEAHDAR